jgi:serpin B
MQDFRSVALYKQRQPKINNIMRSNLLIKAAIAACSVVLLSCSSSEEEQEGTKKKFVNMVAERQSVQLTPKQRVFVKDNNKFSMNFLKTVNEGNQSGNSFVFSPLSITYVLGMVNDGSTGTTEKELEETLGFHSGGIKAVNEYCKNLIENLPKADKNVTLDIANAIFLNKRYSLKEQFRQDMKRYYDAQAEALDFGSPETLKHINGWCKEKTNGMIPSIIENVDENMVSYLLNAIYFKADWAAKFDPKNTRNETFTTERGGKEMPMMHQDVYISYLKNETFSAVRIPYGNQMWSMTVMLPEEGKTTDDVINLLAQDDWNEFDKSLYQPYEVNLSLPRFETSSSTDDMAGGLISLLKKMGIRKVFDKENMEIVNMANTPLYIGMMRQKAAIKVNEKGSEAAAVTVAGMLNTAVEEFPKADFHANRPFVYVISEASSGVILFVGKFNG